MRRRHLVRVGSALLLTATFLISGCAHRAGVMADFPAQAQWSGRLALKVFSSPPQAFNADFELGGSPQSGLLAFFSPLGTTAARLQWSPGMATLTADGETRQFDSLAALARQATGTELPVQALFDWLQGVSTEVPGWQVDMSQLKEGRLQAVRSDGDLPRVELRILLLP
jgi:outer membrane lipoprotein LolB